MLEKSISTPALNWAAPIQKHRIRRSIEDKRKIVLESLSATASIAAVARAYGINANFLHTWRWQYRRGELGEHHSNATLIPVKVSSPISTKLKSTTSDPAVREAHLEIIVDGAKIIVHGSVQADVLQTVIKALQR